MVRKEPALYIFIGQDALLKDAKIRKLKEDFIPAHTQYFNLDILYAKDLTLKGLQEKLLSMPFQAKKRMVIIKEAQGLKNDIKGFIAGYARKPQAGTLLVLDMDRCLSNDEPMRQIARYSEVFRSKEEARPDTFALSRAIDSRKPGYALRLLNQLLKNGEKPERILGGLRYSWEHNCADITLAKKRLRALLGCDIEIKSGKLRPDFALEKLITGLCGFGKPSG
jgi:DNA polymerase III delta subunit